ncbi:uncharacterized protein F5147DRAFT_773336 [Suillus discolor]|uniref:Uncharacterized protein n=1 Tax=Suillus discolor TaxID=1912936 RepID=A0A9P7JU33_9AGAM|nr:uncharacterized protein F5147DRAFT_773336 [Suillus discolor]KAG2109000.1 hypothetical protein F5147DRAFT_773336 [Suillus discolor]
MSLETTSSSTLITPGPSHTNTSPLLTPSDSPSSLTMHGDSIFSKREMSGRLRELQSYLIMLDEVDIQDDEHANELFTRYTIDTVYASYAAAQNRVRQYTQLLQILQ